MEHRPASPFLPPIAESEILQFHPDYQDEKDHDDLDTVSYSSYDEKTSLIHSGSLSVSYSQSISKYQSTQEPDAHSLDITDTQPKAHNITIPHGSVMTDFQASMFLPSLLISSFSTVKQSYDQMARSMAQSMAKRSIYTSKSIAYSIIEKLSDDRGASFLLTIFNILPALLGSALFSMPYTVALGGYLTLPAFIIIALLSDATCLLLVDAMYEVSPRSKRRKRTKLDYVDIAEAAYGRCGSRLMNFTLVFYLFAVSIVNIVLIGKSMYTVINSYAQLSLPVVMSIFSVLVLPTLYVQRLSHLAYLSLLSSLAIWIGGIASVVMFIVGAESWKDNAESIRLFDWNGYALALGIWLYTVIPHTIIPQVEACMKEPIRFTKAVNTSFGVSTPVKVVFAVVGALTYATSTAPIITNNIVQNSYPVSVVINVVITLFAVFNFPLNFFIVCDAFDSFTLKPKHVSLRKGGQYHPYWISLTRPILVAIALGIGLVLPYFELLVGVLGSLLGTLLVFIFPCVFHLKLKWKTLSCMQRAIDIFILIIGIVVGCIGLFASLKGLIQAVS